MPTISVAPTIAKASTKSLVATSPAPGASPILDTFPGALGPSWAQSIDDSTTGNAILTASSGHLNGAPTGSSSIYWQDTQFGADCEVCVTVVTKPGTDGDNVHLGLRITNPAVAAAMTGYQVYLVKNSGGDTASIYKRSGSTLTLIAGVGITWNAGDRFCFRAKGTALSLYRSPDNGATWITTIVTADPTYTNGGYANIGGRFGWTADDFAASTLNGVLLLGSLSTRRGISIAAATPQVASIRRLPAKTSTATQSSAATLGKRPGKPISVTLAPSASLAPAKIYGLVLAVAQKFKPGGLIQQVLTATQSFTATLNVTRVIKKTVTATQGSTATVSRQPGKQLVAGSMMPLPPVFQSLAVVASVARVFQPGRLLSATQPTTATIKRSTSKTLAVAQPTTPLLKRAVTRTLQTVQAISATLRQQRQITVLATQPVDAEVTKTPTRGLDAASTVTAGLAKQPTRTLSANANALATFASTAVKKLDAGLASITALASLARTVARNIDIATIEADATLSKTNPVPLDASTTIVAETLERSTSVILSAGQTTVATVNRASGRTIAATQTVIATLAKIAGRRLTFRGELRIRARFSTDRPAIFRVGQTGHVLYSKAGRIAHEAAGRIETFIERLL